MSNEHSRRTSVTNSHDYIPSAPPLPAPRPLQRARDAVYRWSGYQYSRPASPHGSPEEARPIRARYASLSAAQNASTSHRTGLEINTIAINEAGTHALLGGKAIFKTVKIEDGTCAEELNLRSAIRSTPKQASGQHRQIYEIDIADAAWAKGDCGHFVAAATSSGKIILYNLSHAGLEHAQLYEHSRQVHRVTFNPHGGHLLLSGSQDGTVRLWDVRNVREASTLQSRGRYSGQSDGVRDVKWSPTDGVDFAFGTDTGWIQRWDMRNLKMAKVKIPAHSQTCNSIDWHPDGKHIASAGSDKTVRVWEFSANRRGKANWEIRTPFPVLNARWRPPCEASIPNDFGTRQCTQLVTSYDRAYPTLHVWDIRRPAIPFREMTPYKSAPTDLLWHSQDLLWTVGREGVFLQTDIQHAPKPITRRNLQAVAISSQGDLNFVTQRRRRDRPRNHSYIASNYESVGHSPKDGVLSRSWADDSLDHSFLSVLPPKPPKHRASGHSTRASSINLDLHQANSSQIIKLDDLMSNRRSFRPHQVACRGLLPDKKDAKIFAYLARKYAVGAEDILNTEDVASAFEMFLEQNSRAAEMVGLYRLVQTWKIVSFTASNFLRFKVDQDQKRKMSTKPQIRTPSRKGRLRRVLDRLIVENGKSPITTPASMKPYSSLAQQLALSDYASDQPTPLARPFSRGKFEGASNHNSLPDPDTDEALTLPPSISPVLPHGAAGAARGFHGERRPTLTASNLDGLQRLQDASNGVDKAAMVRRWSVEPKEHLNMRPAEATNGISANGTPPKLEKHDSNESFTFLHETIEPHAASNPSSNVSVESGPLQMVSERPSRPAARNGAVVNGRTETVDFGVKDVERDGLAVIDWRDPPENLQSEVESSDVDQDETLHTSAVAIPKRPNSVHIQPAIPLFNPAVATPAVHDLGYGSYPDENGICPPRSPRKVVPHNKPGLNHASPVVLPIPTMTKALPRSRIPDTLSPNFGEDLTADDSALIDETEDGDDDIEEDKPFTLVSMTQELVNYYAAQGDVQTAAHMILLLGPILPRTHPLTAQDIELVVSSYLDCFTGAGYVREEIEILFDRHLESVVASGVQPLQIEAILSCYHEQLISQGLLNEAAILRNLAFPTYPTVYEQAQKDVDIYIKCGECNKPITDGRERLLCESCGAKQASCPVCWSEESPTAVDAEAARTKSKLLSTCLLCNHSGHATCLRLWFDESGAGDGGCPTPGCLCDCVVGSWRAEKAKLADRRRRYRGHGRVKSDDWNVSESKAVGRARSVLGVRGTRGIRPGFSA